MFKVLGQSSSTKMIMVHHCLDHERNEIRLLMLHSSNDVAADVECELILAELNDDSLRFSALSYM